MVIQMKPHQVNEYYNMTIIDYKAGNILSVCNALDLIWVKYKVSNDKNEIKNSDKIIFPWVWHCFHAMQELKKLDLIDTIRNFEKPFLWICLWMQLLFSESEEWNTKCLWIIEWKIKKFQNNWHNKIPHMWWNDIKIIKENKLIDNDLKYYYFVHSYFAEVNNCTLTSTNYINHFSSSVQKNNFFWVQFHPEKSWNDWLNILRNFINI